MTGVTADQGPLAGGEPPTVGRALQLFGEADHNEICFQGAKVQIQGHPNPLYL